ncbi:MAG: (2Fe-2S)-binding protein [Synergistaceae bacterium]|jgi:carbon-monoxide dehydrogenase small subunit|nr:(2Fe-2S)-binding protein [Clostridiaceae bacterium]NLX75661.1 (2Fe-2S)-binding protein [Synergistaceae bacterium]
MNKIKLNFNLNGKDYEIFTDAGSRMLDVIRNDLHLTGTKEGCSVGECGACTVILNGEAVSSCLILAPQMDGGTILTIEGMSELDLGKNLQSSFVEEDAVQCGFCTPGFILSAYALLQKNPDASRAEIREAIAGNICRCTGYIPIVNAIENAAEKLNSK